MLPEFYNQLGALHGTIMVFLGVVPIGVGGFGNFVVPLQIGAAAWRSRASTWRAISSRRRGLNMLASFFLPGVPRSRLDVYHRWPTSIRADRLGHRMIFIITSRCSARSTHHHDHPTARPRDELLALSVLRGGAVVTSFLLLLGSAARSGRGDADHGPARRHELFPADR